MPPSSLSPSDSLALWQQQGDRHPRATLLAAIQTLEQARNYGRGVLDLNGCWQLLWSSGIPSKQATPSPPTAASAPLSIAPRPIWQRIDVESGWLTNTVHLGPLRVTVAGPFVYAPQKRMEFTFTEIQGQVAPLPIVPIPLGRWAKGWLQTTYLDSQLHIERGDRGGVSVYQRVSGL